VQHIKELLGADFRGKRVLDFGAGGGYMSLYCAQRGASVTLVEHDHVQLAKAKDLLGTLAPQTQCAFYLDETVPSDLAGQVFDLIIAKDILEHVSADVDLLRGFAERQVVGGRLLVSTQNSLSINYVTEGFLYHRLWRGERDWYGWDDTHVRFYTPGSLRKRVSEAGYIPKQWRSSYVIPYDLCVGVLLGRNLAVPGLRHIDLMLGRFFPFNRLGWNLIMLAERLRG
jgi:2-polyprenyl-6-hydroxyphenyl methylase/3-demethylubiquinone-9 3-methyltransferase